MTTPLENGLMMMTARLFTARLDANTVKGALVALQSGDQTKARALGGQAVTELQAVGETAFADELQVILDANP